ncbi:MAG: HPr family phosphocarrier protein [Ruminococcaceae bacterium]|nr:HPr family phosphocarrier protein [Oscillospiraceae bacterium]
MKKVNIKFDTIVQIQNFVNNMSCYASDVDLISGSRTVDAKSIIGVFSLDISNPITLQASGKDEDAVIEAVKDMIVE